MTDTTPDHLRRRTFLTQHAPAAVIHVLGGAYLLASETQTAHARSARRPDGRPRLPPGQKLITALKPMGGQEGDPSKSKFRLRIHGLVERPETIGMRDLLRMENVERPLDVHCVTGWTVLDALWKGVPLKTLAKRAGVKPEARHVIFEAAHGYTANVPIAEALQPNVLIAHRLNGRSLPRANGAPVRALVPDLYFWKSAKWLTGIRFVRRDKPGYWEKRGYHNHGDPWKEERYG